VIFPGFSDATNIQTIALRLGISFVLSFIIGFERERSGQPAGLRTHVLISIGSTMFMILSLAIPKLFSGRIQSDPTRIAAQIVTGIGFLGAGAIIKIGINVKGLTTAANIWVVSAIGMTAGAGLYIASFIISAITLITLVLLNKLEKKLITGRRHKKLSLQFKRGELHFQEARDILLRHGMTITNVDFSESAIQGTTEITFSFYYNRRKEISTIFMELRSIEDLIRVEINER
jgi:putative Mg2+ transporter-C (MgtC) family protein